jgi:hypothetical protein
MPYLAWWVYVTISEMHETGGVWDKISCYQIIKQQRIKELSGVKESLLSYYWWHM